MYKIKTIIPAIVLSSFITGVANAQIHEQGFYTDLNVGTLYESVSFFGATFRSFGNLGINVNGGYLWSRYFGTEIGYTNYGVGRNSINNVDIALKGVLPLGNDFTLFGKIGPAYLFAGSDHQIDGFAGIGASYSLTQKLDATLQAQGVSDGFFTLGLLSLGLEYHFD